MIVSFYSYKGGVGRTQLLSNLAAYFCYKKQKRVLIIDWDLEAPGVHFYFGKKYADLQHEGLIDVLQRYVENRNEGIEGNLPTFTPQHISNLKTYDKGTIDLIPAGNYGDLMQYKNKIIDFDWYNFYEMLDGKRYIEFLKQELKNLAYDLIFIDSRTGLNDYSNICNIQMPDMNVLVVAPTHQNMEGCSQVAKQIMSSPYTQSGLFREGIIMPIFSRVHLHLDNPAWYDNTMNNFFEHFGEEVNALLPKINQHLPTPLKESTNYIAQTILVYEPNLSLWENVLFGEDNKQSEQITITNKYINIADFITSIWVDYKIKNMRNNSLDLSGTKFRYEYLSDILSNIKNLDISNSQISDISFLKSLTNLTTLNISHNQISDISFLKDLINLTSLNISHNQISDASFLQDLTNLTNLNISHNKISDVTPLQKLKALTHLNIHTNQISDISPLQGIKTLTWLNMGNNQVIDITPLQKLKYLTYLYIYTNKITDITPLQKLKDLTELSVSNNQITDTYPLHKLTALSVLDISNNKITDISPLHSFTTLALLDLNANPFLEKVPRDIQKRRGLEILRYWIDFYGIKKEAKPLREAKVVFVGEGGSGKTSLMHALLYGRQAQTTRTEKIEIHTNDTLFTYGEKKEPLKLRFWDFGGQDIMHATHKFFMSSRTLYVLVVHGRKDETDTLQNWIEMLKSSIEDSPVLLVVNHLDELRDTHRLGDLGLKAQFPNLVLPVIETSWATGRGIKDLKEAIQTELQKMPHFQEDFSSLYQSIKEQLETIQEPYINYQQYESLCAEVATQEGESGFEKVSQSLLADILNDLGVMLNFRKRSDNLEDLLIFKPAWIVDGVYQIINAEETQRQKGKISEETVSKLLKSIGYQNNTERNFIVEMMKHFKLAYPKEDLGRYYYLIPSLFDKNPPRTFSAWQASSPLRVRFQYEIWRNDYISYFLEDQYKNLVEGTHWVNGAILQYGEQQARIEAVRYQKHIDIQVAGTQDKRYALWRIREALAQVHAMFDEAKLGISMWVIHEEAGKQDEFEYEYLKLALEEGETHIFSKVFRKKLSISELLAGVSLNKTETKETLQKALAYLDKANIAGYFEEMDKVEKDFQQNMNYSQLKKDFTDGEKSNYLASRLRTFAQSL